MTPAKWAAVIAGMVVVGLLALVGAGYLIVTTMGPGFTKGFRKAALPQIVDFTSEGGHSIATFPCAPNEATSSHVVEGRTVVSFTAKCAPEKSTWSGSTASPTTPQVPATERTSC